MGVLMASQKETQGRESIMEKKRYQVHIADQEVIPVEDTAKPTFVIEATETELGELRALFDKVDLADNKLLGRAKTPYEPQPEGDQDIKNIPYDNKLKDVYRYVYQLGVPETRAYIEEMQLAI
jgi:hypothetical protein